MPLRSNNEAYRNCELKLDTRNTYQRVANNGMKIDMLRGDAMMISLEERYENFRKTIQECGSYLLTESDDTIKHNLFEEFSIDVISFLHEDTLNLFLDEGMIDDDILKKKHRVKKFIYAIRKKCRVA